MKRIKFFLVIFIFTISMLICGIKSSAESELIETDWAVDVFNKTLDNGIGRFICKASDESSPIKEYSVSSYYVFEYLRNDSKTPLCDKYVLISKYNVPEFVYSGLENEEIIYGIHDGYWTQTEIGYYTDCIEYNCALEWGLIPGHDVYDSDSTVLALFEFLNIDIDEIYEIEFNFKVFRLKRYGFLWTKKKSSYKNINSFVTADSVRVNEKEYNGDGQILGFFKLRNIWLYNPITKYETPVIIDGKSYSYCINTGYRMKSNKNYNYLSDPLDENYVPEGIAYMKFESKGIVYVTDNLKLKSFYTSAKYEKNLFDKTIDLVNRIGKFLLIAIIIICVLFIGNKLIENKKLNKKSEVKK